MTAPLFGPDSIPHKISSFFGLIGTFVLWLIFILCGIFIPVSSGKKNLKPVQIVLSSTPVIEKKIEDSQSSSPVVDENQAANVEVVAETPGEQVAMPEPQILQEPIPVQEVIAESVIETKTAPIIPEVVENTPAPVPPKIEEAPKPNVNPIQKPKEKIVEKPLPKKEPVVEKVVENKSAKPVESVKKTEPVPEVEPVLYKSVDDLMAEQMNTTKKKTQDFDWDAMFGDSDSTVTEKTVASTPKKVDTQNTVAGTAGETSERTTSQRTESTSSQNRNTTGSSSAETSGRLSKILNATEYSSSNGGSFGTIKAKTISSGTGSTSMEMSDGSTRTLLVPSKPEINLSDDASSLIDSTKTVTITFEVLSGGNINGISIKPEAILPKLVRDEIRNQLMNWRFEASSNTATATFEFTIEKR